MNPGDIPTPKKMLEDVDRMVAEIQARLPLPASEGCPNCAALEEELESAYGELDMLQDYLADLGEEDY